MSNTDQQAEAGATDQHMSGVHRRLVLGVGATALGPVVTLILQIVNVPVFLHYWGAEKYGEWLLISAIPTYLAMSDMGFGTVAGNDMTMRVARGDIDGALRTFQSTWKLVTLVSIGLAALVLPLLFVLPLEHLLKLTTISFQDARLAMMILAVDSLACLQTSLPVSALKSAGANHMAALGINVTRLLEGVCVLVAVILGHGPVFLACTLLTVRAFGNLSLAVLSKSLIPWLHFSFRLADKQALRELLRPAMAFMAFPAANAINLQGALLAIGIVLGPVYVAMFSPLRTVARTAMQATETLKLSFWPELSAAYGAHRWELARKLHHVSCQLALVASGMILLVLGTLGPRLLHLWTHNKILISLPTFYLLLAGVMVNSLWNTSSAVPIAANRHQRIALAQVISAVVSLGLAVVLMRPMGLPGCALGLLLGETYMVMVVVPTSTKLLHEDLPSYIRSLFDLRPLVQTLRRQVTSLAAR